MLEKTIDSLKKEFSDSILDETIFRGDVSFVVKREKILDIARFLKEDQELSYDYLADICGVDYPGRIPRFDIVYNLYSLKNRSRIRLKVMVDESDIIPSMTVNWQSANWLEREVYDMLGIKFGDHPDLRRILLPDDWNGHPLRKDFPLNREEVRFSHNVNDPPRITE